ncbi:MAG: 3-deoxy-8-phosphooctulonate synthase [Planctomycetota bacterium]|jgi:2-dehydro-3-deoxyphosphooctonate aldolase (KDO 8-P synthase)
MNAVNVKKISIGSGHPLALIAGPCVIENESDTIRIAEKICRIVKPLGIPFIFKASYEKDNRSSANYYRGPGLEVGLRILERVKKDVGVPILSDIHRETDVKAAASVLDILQVPAFLCQQTSLLLAMGKTGKPINIKKGQFLSPYTMKSPVEKVSSTGNNQILLTERGTTFGYDRLVSDICSIPIMQNLGFPVIFDATHIVRCYGVPSSRPEGGKPQFINSLACAGVAAGCDAIFIETHPNPINALCDASSMLPLTQLKGLLEIILPLSRIVRK